jgi:hypothetical protein
VIERTPRAQTKLIEDLLDVADQHGQARLSDRPEARRAGRARHVPPAAEASRSASPRRVARRGAESPRPRPAPAGRLNLLSNAISSRRGGRVEVRSTGRGRSRSRGTDKRPRHRGEVPPYVFDRFRQATAPARRSAAGSGSADDRPPHRRLHGGTVHAESAGPSRARRSASASRPRRAGAAATSTVRRLPTALERGRADYVSPFVNRDTARPGGASEWPGPSPLAVEPAEWRARAVVDDEPTPANCAPSPPPLRRPASACRLGA